MKLKLQRREKKTREIKQQKKIKTTTIPAKQINQKQDISNYIHQENLEDKKIEHKLKQEEQTEN